MNTAIKTETWYQKDGTGLLEKRTYESGQVRWYEKGYKSWHRSEEDMALMWLDKKYFLTEEENHEYTINETVRMMNNFLLSLAQKAGQ